jgi:hypothetical protein
MSRPHSTMVPVGGSGALRSDPERMREYKRKWIAKRRADWLADNGPCIRCGSWDDLEVDHIDQGKKVAHKVWSWSQARRDAELAKCQVLCKGCHLDKSRADGDIARFGSDNPSTVLTEDQVVAIRRRVAAGEPVKRLVRDYPVSYTQLRRVVSGEHWAWVGASPEEELLAS